MYLFSRFRHVNSASAPEAVAAAVQVAGMITTATGFEMSAWMTVASREVGRINWSVMFEHLSDLEDANRTLTAMPEYADFVRANDKLFDGPAEDVLSQIVHGEPDPERTVNVVMGTRATCANGMLGAGMAGGVELAEAFTRITGAPMLFGSSVTGLYGGVVWIAGVADMAEAEAAVTAVNSDPAWVALVDQNGPYYQPGGETIMFQRLG
jgi:hypothetical protein